MQRKKILEEKPEPRRNRKKHAVAAVRTIKGEQTLIVWVYQSGRSKVPALVIGETKTDYGIYSANDRKWHQSRINIGYEERKLIDPKGFEVIKGFHKGDSPRYGKDDWVCWVDIPRERILENRRIAIEKRRKQQLQKRCESVYEIPEEMLRWSKRLLACKHTLTYQKKGRMATVQCSCCGNTATYMFEPVTLEDMAAKKGEKPYHNELGVCTVCGTEGIYKAAGRYKGVYTQTKQTYMIQGTKDPGKVVVRYVEIESIQTSAYERIGACEIARAFIQEGKVKVQYDYRKWNPYTGKHYWDDCNYGMFSGSKPTKIETNDLWPGSYAELANTRMKYSGIEYYKMHTTYPDVVGYLQAYNMHPVVEILTKMGLEKLVQRIAYGDWRILKDESPKKIHEMLGIDKQQLRVLRKYHGDVSLLRIMQYEKNHGIRWDEDMENWLADVSLYEEAYDSILRHMSMTKFRNYTRKVAENKMLPTTNVARTYVDYLNMRERLGYDMTNTVYLYPHDMYAGHAQMVREQNEKKQDLWKAEKEKTYPNIRKNFKKLDKRYHYEQGDYFIRPCKSASEIIDEGRLQHHCVGGDNYLRRHHKGTSYIMILRRRSEPNVPFVTVEMNKRYQVVQWYGPNDTKNMEEIGLNAKQIDAWLKQYTLKKTQRVRKVVDAADAGVMAPAV